MTQTGRLSMFATPPTPIKQYARELYSVEFELSVLNFLDKNEMKLTLEIFF
jgi:hypothetical protein